MQGHGNTRPESHNQLLTHSLLLPAHHHPHHPTGLGGGQTGDYKTPAQSAFNVASSPYWGVEGVYSQQLDPWRSGDNRQFMQNYYQLTTEFAKKGGVNYPVSAIYM
jgi:hypothetical protein